MKLWRLALAVFWVSVLMACSEYGEARRAYERGDYKLAYQHLSALAGKGDARAQFDLAHMHFSGIGVPPDTSRGWSYLMASAKGGNTAAMVELAMRYASGIGTEQSLIMAARWYRHAAGLGDPIAAYNLASMHEAGTEVAKDPLRAYAWYVIAQKNGNQGARERVDELRSKMLREDVERGDALVKQLLINPES
ncbi:MAG: hypothetical protein RIR70_2235 [Pseudomonadota bacterium]|jgi:TPR repeat protein